MATMDRRHFLLGAGAGAALLGLQRNSVGRARPKPTDRNLVLLFLHGGDDGLNTLVPTADERYYRARPALGIARESAHRLDERNGLHPALTHTANSFRSGRIGFLRGVGYPNPNLSHFRAKDIWNSASLHTPTPATGWLGRFADTHLAARGSPMGLVSLGQVSTPHALRGTHHLSYALPSSDGFAVRRAPSSSSESAARARWRALEKLNGGVREDRLVPVGASVLAADRATSSIATALERPADVPYPESTLAENLRVVARLLEADLGTRCFHVTHSGYDTHASQAHTHNLLLGVLDEALHAFLLDLATIGRIESTLVLVISEFGRRVAENGMGATAGTDHGTSSLVWTAGGGARPGIHGPAPDLEHLDADGNLVPSSDFRSVYAAVLEDWFGVPSEPILGARFQPAEILR
ncbi:MAG: DUF1501 domain-containing protein [Planctomycetaceae bacterium]|nr:DUF1501 domain-containing protein [Planctomycetaceae bacterium]